ncbi:hypothetical protein F6V30_14510 [Oryzomonas sagensis]|uniref:ATP-binding protein n=1 Tax=Oryzomonas sagensis TaxID=2603857 RepID=A0ABQ6TLH8_9BACT|nr:hypothetical protein [Oryzomonas sagensis]KAB0669044.1 hypothetical protein F6V30_14510 [Oryzomonas sagensis]
MSGQDGNRGYLIQSVIALLESLNRSDWDQLTLEPTHVSDKIDISWSGASSTKACQVKSSINQISISDVQKWANELEQQSTADELTLILVGPCSASVAKVGRHGKVNVPCPKNLDFDGLLGLAAHLLDRFLVQEQINARSPSHRELMVRALVTELSIFASSGSPFGRRDFVDLLKAWLKNVETPSDLRWELVDFSYQRGIENAIAGKRLGPADVNQCPSFSICGQVIIELERSHWFSIAGQQGCGKSITAWQAAKKFHDRGYSVWRPHYNAKGDELLKHLPMASPSVLVIDDAQQFGAGFADRLSERSCEKLKVILTNTLADIVTPNPSCISPTSCVDELKNKILTRRDEILPIVQRFDDEISDRYMGTSFERRIDDCARQKTPWEFFWVLRGGWRTAREEYESLKQVPNANALVTAIAIRQISSCDAGISGKIISRISGELGLTGDEADKAISHLASLGLILISDDIFRTKHISYAHRIIETSLNTENQETWPSVIDMLVATVLDDNTSLQGVCWVLNAIQLIDAVRFSQRKKLRPVLEPLMNRCRHEWRQTEWAVGCVSLLFKLFEFSLEEMLTDKELLLEWFTASTGRIARFSSEIANHLICASDKKGCPETSDVAKTLFEQIDLIRLTGLANNVTLDDFYSFGEILNRLAYYHPPWSEAFLAQFDWSRALKIILTANASRAYAVDKLVGSLTLLSRRERCQCNLQYIEDIVPFIVRAIGTDPIHTINSMDNIFWYCLGFIPHFLRGGEYPDERQTRIAQSIVAQLDPLDFALAMKNIISRDMENLARCLSIIHEVDAEFISRVASHVPEEEFDVAARSDWSAQSDELRHLLGFFCIGKDRQPARNWVVRNEQVIAGPLEPMLAAVAPETAINFFKSGKGVKLIGVERRWNETVLAIAAIAEVDRDVCIDVVRDQLQKLEESLYDLTLDSPKYIATFFHLIHELSVELFSSFVGRLNLDDPRAVKTIGQLVKSQPKELAHYKKLARLAHRMGGEVGVLGERLLMRLKEATATAR